MVATWGREGAGTRRLSPKEGEMIGPLSGGAGPNPHTAPMWAKLLVWHTIFITRTVHHGVFVDLNNCCGTPP